MLYPMGVHADYIVLHGRFCFVSPKLSDSILTNTRKFVLISGICAASCGAVTALLEGKARQQRRSLHVVALGHILEGISAILGAWLMFMLVYQMFLTIFGFKRDTRDYAPHDPQSRFLVLGVINRLCGEMFARSITQSARKQLTQTCKKSCARSIEKVVKATSTKSQSEKRQNRKIRAIPSGKSKQRQRSLAQHTAR